MAYNSFGDLFSGFKMAFKTGIYTVDSVNNSVVINPTTVKSITAYSAGVNSIANAIASIPFKLRQNKDYINSDLNYLIKEKPNRFQTAYDFKRHLINDMLYRGTGFGKIVRDNDSGLVEELIPIEFDSVGDAKIVDGELYYMVNNIPINNDDLIVLKNSGTGAFGDDPISVFADSLGVTLSSQRYAKKTFESDGANIKGVITSENKLNEKQQKEFRESIQANYTGVNSKSLMVLDKGFDFKPVALSPEQVKLIETRNLQVAEIARILNIPISIIASETPANYNTIEGQQLDFYKRTLAPIIYMIEAELKHKLLTRSEIKNNFYIKGSIESLLRGDTKSRSEFYKELFYLGAISPEEIRELEDMPIEINGETFIQANLIPSKLISEYYESKIDSENSKVNSNNNE